MDSRELMLALEEITEADIPELTAVMTRAFDDDAQRHLGVARGGPEGYDNGQFFRRWLFGCRESVGYKIMAGGRTIGGAIVWTYDHGHNILGTISVDPAYQNQGIARQAWEFIEARHPQTQRWTLETPVWATKNHYFYETKCGFRRVEERGDTVVYRKDIA